MSTLLQHLDHDDLAFPSGGFDGYDEAAPHRSEPWEPRRVSMRRFGAGAGTGSKDRGGLMTEVWREGLNLIRTLGEIGMMLVGGVVDATRSARGGRPAWAPKVSGAGRDSSSRNRSDDKERPNLIWARRGRRRQATGAARSE